MKKLLVGSATNIMHTNHSDISVDESGFVINPMWPHLGATPDGVVNCTCCGKGILKIKCSFATMTKQLKL